MTKKETKKFVLDYMEKLNGVNKTLMADFVMSADQKRTLISVCEDEDEETMKLFCLIYMHGYSHGRDFR